MSETEANDSLPAKLDTILDVAVRDGIATVAGILSSDRKDLVLSAGKVMQTIRGGGFLKALEDEFKEYRDKGRIKDEYLVSDQAKNNLQILLNFIDDDSPDEVRFNAMKAIFLGAATEEMSSRDDTISTELLKIGRSLTSGELLVLVTAYRLKSSVNLQEHWGAAQWVTKVAQESHLDYPELVEIHEQKLMEKYLLSGRTMSDRSGVSVNPHFRLSGLAIRLCDFIKAYGNTQNDTD
jgi:hypothetical protein